MNKKFLLLSLEDEKTKKIANAVNNKTSKKILEFLAEKDATESQIAKELNLPISSVHYNIDLLLDAKLIEWQKYHYSEKGKEVRHYTLANKYIIIAPKEEKTSILEQLKKIIPQISITLISAALIETYSRFFQANQNLESLAADTMIQEAPLAKSFATQQSTQIITQTTPILSEPTIFFLIGAIFILAITLLLSIKRKKE